MCMMKYTSMLKAFIGIGLLMVLGAVACAPDVKDLRVQGVEQYRDRQYIESMATLRYALSQNPNDAMSNYYMGLNYRALAEERFQHGDVNAAKRTLEQAIIYFTQAVKTWPNYMAAVGAKTEALEARGKYDSALAVAKNVANNNRGIGEHFVFLGDEYRERGDFDNALRAYKTALATDPDNAKAYLGMGMVYQRANDEAAAATAYARAYELDPSLADSANAVAGSGWEREAAPAGYDESGR